MLSPRHGDMPAASGPGIEQHWGYFTRQMPCEVDEGKCGYLDAVYGGHDLSMIYSVIIWATFMAIVLFCFIGHYCNPISRSLNKCGKKEMEYPVQGQSSLYRMRRSLTSFYHRHLINESLGVIFGRTTRFNILVLVILAGYVSIFTFVGITYKTWYSPVKGTDLVTVRIGLGPLADRIGVMAYALTPLSVMLCTRESILSLLTGIPYHHFNFLHRWLGYIIYIQSVIHTFSWTLIEAKLYQPQPETWNGFINQEYIIWGIVAMILLSFLVFFSTQRAIRLTGYEFFRKSHYVIAMIYIGACWGHWSKLSCWMIASLIVWLLDRGIRLLRTFILHIGHHSTRTHSMWGFHVPKAQITHFPNDNDGDVIRLDFKHDHSPWDIGQHFYLCFPDLNIWQAHPMTPSSVPGATEQSHTYIIRAKKGITRDLANIARGAKLNSTSPAGQQSTPIVLSGPYGQSIIDTDLYCTDDINLVCVAGGTGVTFVLPLLQAIVLTSLFPKRRSQIEFIWIIRRKADMRWLSAELDALRTAAQMCPHFRIRIFVSREGDGMVTPEVNNEKDKEVAVNTNGASSRELSEDSDSDSEAFQVYNLGTAAHTGHPDIPGCVKDFVSRTTRGPTRVVASGPAGLITSLRTVIASCNDPGRVWKGEERYDVQMVHDDRLEY